MEERGSSKSRHFEDRGFEDFFFCTVCFVCHMNHCLVLRGTPTFSLSKTPMITGNNCKSCNNLDM